MLVSSWGNFGLFSGANLLLVSGSVSHITQLYIYIGDKILSIYIGHRDYDKP